MPIFIDRHYSEGATKRAIADAHDKDLKVQKKYGVKFLTYWFDEDRNTTFCLVEAPNIEAVNKTHDEAHGDIASEIIEVDSSVVKSFLGRIEDPLPDDKSGSVEIDSAFRAIMFTDLKDSTMMTSLYGDRKALHLLHIHNAITRNAIRKYDGTEIKHTGDGFMVSFSSVDKQVECACEIQNEFKKHNKNNTEELLYLRIGLSAGEPIEEHGDFFGSAVQLAARLCSIAEPEKILASKMVFDHCDSKKVNGLSIGEIQPKGFTNSIEVFEIKDGGPGIYSAA